MTLLPSWRRPAQLTGALFALGAIFGSAVAWAQASGVPDAPGAPDDGPSLGWMLVKTCIVLGIVVMLVYLTLNVGLRRFLGIAPTGAPGSNKVVSVVERVTLDPKRAVFVLKAGKEYLLVGAGEEGMSLLSKLDPADVESIRAAPPQRPPAALPPFLQKLLARNRSNVP